MATLKQSRILTVLTGGFLTAASLISNSAFATLGQHEASVESDRQALHGTRALVAKNLFHVHEITNPGGTTREYVSNDGVVFAVTWNGISEPNLSQLFGDYYKEYKNGQAKSVKMSRRAPLQIKSDGIIVEKSGHMRDIQGRAYVPSLVPNGVNLQDIQ